jgi:hypothetical protein
MIWFQVITLPLFGTLLLRSLRQLLRGSGPRAPRVLGVAVWGLAALAVAQPEWTTRVAVRMGIGRGADLVLYLLVIAFLGACFHFYNRTRQLESHLTDVVRHLAIRDGLTRWPQPRA